MFSKRLGIQPKPTSLQSDTINIELKNRLWNFVSNCLFDRYSELHPHNYTTDIVKIIVDSIFKNNYDDYNKFYKSHLKAAFHKTFFDTEWYNIYNILEVLYQKLPYPYLKFNADEIKKTINGILESEFSAYRLIDDNISPISSDLEIKTIEESIDKFNSSSLKNVAIHLKTSLQLISNKPIPDYRNSIKESISAVEAVTCKIANSPKSDLSTALKIISSKNLIPIHKGFVRGIDNIYGYTSDDDGIRHKIIDDPSVNFEDAQFMLVFCSAVSNYLVQKADKAGITLK